MPIWVAGFVPALSNGYEELFYGYIYAMLRRFFSSLLLATLLLGLFFYQIWNSEVTVVRERLQASEMAHIKLRERLLEIYFIGHISDVELLSELQDLKEFAVAENRYSRSALKQHFFSFLKKKEDYVQIRFLDKNGFEKIRVDVKNGQPLFVPDSQLQDKSRRYYFVEIRKLEPGQLYLSPLDLNVEHHQVERPFKPMLRIGVPIFNQYAEFQGALVVNYLADSMLKVLKNSNLDSPGENSLLNNNGFWLAAENEEDEWGFMFAERQAVNFGRRYPSAWKRIKAAASGQFEEADGLFTFSTFNPKASGWRSLLPENLSQPIVTSINSNDKSYPWKIVSFVPAGRLAAIVSQNLKNRKLRWLGFFGSLLFLSAAFLWFFFKSRQKDLEQQERIARINVELEDKIKERTRQLNRSRYRLANILKTTAQGFVMVDVAGTVLDINPAMLKLLGCTREQVVGRSSFDFIEPESLDSLRSRFEDRKKGLGEEYDMKVLRSDGTVRFCHFVSTPLVNEEKEIEGSFALISDIQERLEIEDNLKKAKAAAEKNSAAKTLFLSSMSHEFRTPMNSILGFAQLLESDASLDSRQLGFVRNILTSGSYLKSLIDDILDLAKLEAGTVEINVADIDLCQVILELVTMVTPAAQEREIEFVVQKPDVHHLVLVDPVRLQQIILNLINNAIKYNFVGGRVEMFCEELVDNRVRINIVDNGPGIPAEKLDQLFDPFNRLGAETSTIQGAGLGLAISKNLAELMNCSLGLLDNPASGCHFFLDIPLAESAAMNEKAETRGSNESANFSAAGAALGCTLLYIEDDELNRILMESILEQRPSFTLISAVNGRQGLELAEKERPGIIFTDIGLPDIDGFAVLEELRKNSVTKALPVVALSGNATPRDVEKALAAGFAAYLTKPFNIGQLFATIDEILAKN